MKDVLNHQFGVDVGFAVGELVTKYHAGDDDAGRVLMALSVALLTLGGKSETDVRDDFETALKLGPLVAVMAGRVVAAAGDGAPS